MNLSKFKHSLRFVLLLTMGSFASFTSALTQAEPKLYVVFDSSLSMQSSQATIVALLEQLNDRFKTNSKLTDVVRFIAFRDEVSLDTMGTLTSIANVLSKTILENSEENILPVLEALSTDATLGNAIAIVFSDGKNSDLENVNLDSLIKRFKHKNTQFQVVKNHPNWCGKTSIFAVNSDKQILDSSGKFTKCNHSSYIKNRGYGDEFNNTGLAKLAFATGGLVWPIMNFKTLIKNSKLMSPNYLEIVATKLGDELSIKGEQTLYANVQYSETVHIGETVYFEVLSNRSDEGIGKTISWQWDFNGDGQTDDVGTLVAKSFDNTGEYFIRLELSNEDYPVVSRTLMLPITVLE